MTGRTVLVTGARGKTGVEVTSRLRRSGADVRAGSSRPGAGMVRFDWDDPASWRDAVAGVDAVFLVRPDIPAAPELAAGLVEANPDAHVVLLSEQGAEAMAPEAWARRVEDAVAARASSWTWLRPSWFHQVLTDPRFYRDAVRDDGVLSLPSGGGAIAWVDARDIADVAVAALLAPDDHNGRAHTITGPEALTVAAVAAELSARLGRRVRADDPPPETAVQDVDAWTADILNDLHQRIRDGGFADLSPAVKEITGHEPTSMGDFIAAHLDHWNRAAD
ncbi:NAD(P)H-binding protein [Actinomadura syzygii]|uniref:NAD(P)H-binding protein n=1 Tax=Actinomadura syzygii TaxID=1427538 RepID=A0A5D0U4Z6_9ACTN|nr:NAD(P)H-binding protein [Actinomadura syzygii]TYC13137.1 NAD(P)H-binding protein [Actinomadura syzygii]